MSDEQITVFTVSDGDLVLELRPAPGGWYAVRAPFEPGVNTQAKSIEEAFDMARDAMSMLHAARLKHRAAIESALRVA